ncbi:hypothetical protein ONE63_002503 [Megalurothrips usitatus]|uniref:Tetraspanin n=1 Tax=Megalurothrips usitatus TaxID=439358 RepID=A0AAV7XFF8_9NEOP|nr:hypothetical protein ONE63_002503 [Megalurothrips usitatus]
MAAAGLRCGSTTIKYLLFFFNFLFVLCGLVILVVGGLAATSPGIGGFSISGPVIFILVVGGAIFLVSFFGCCGAVRESHCMLVTFACLLLTIIVCEVVAAVLLFLAANGAGGVDLEKAFSKAFEDAKADQSNKGAMDAVNAVQQAFQCCGVKDSSMWAGKVPNSCCPSNQCSGSNQFTQGCLGPFKDFIHKYGLALGVLAIGVAVIEVLGVWFSLALAGEIKRLSR